jgi:hypothetical protein
MLAARRRVRARIAAVNVEDIRRTSYEIWKAMAPGWERRRARLAEALTPVRGWLVRELAPQPGDTSLSAPWRVDTAGSIDS